MAPTAPPTSFPGRIASIRSSHPRLGAASGLTGGDGAGVTTIGTETTTTFSPPTSQLEVPIRAVGPFATKHFIGTTETR